MKKSNSKSLIPDDTILSKIYQFRNTKTMLDIDLAELYGVPTKVLNQAVKRNIKRFPQPLFMFQLSKEEFENWRSQFVTSNNKIKMGMRRCPYAFTEQGVAMLSSVLNSDRAIQVNIQIIILFTKIREMLHSHLDVKRKIMELEHKYDHKFNEVFLAIKKLQDKDKIHHPKKPRKELGFHTTLKKK